MEAIVTIVGYAMLLMLGVAVATIPVYFAMRLSFWVCDMLDELFR